MKHGISSGFLAAAASLAVLFTGCEYKIPQSIYPASAGADPVITAVVPDSAFGGVTTITIQGSNFAPSPGLNFVYFGSGEAVIQSATETELRVVRPLSIGDTATIRVVVRDAFGAASIGPYKLEKGIVDVGDLGWIFSIGPGRVREPLCRGRKGDREDRARRQKGERVQSSVQGGELHTHGG